MGKATIELRCAGQTARYEETLHALEALDQELNAWLSARHLADADSQGRYLGRHKTQLNILGTLFLNSSDTLRKDATRNLPAINDAGAFMRACREYDKAAIWLRRLWDYYAERFAQRDGDRKVAELLRAADEVVWSCYSQIFRRANRKPPRPPLAFVESQYSLAAVQSDQPIPVALQLEAAAEMTTLLDDYRKRVPVSLLRLPPACIDAPWWLIYVAHEAGHHVQNDLGMIVPFSNGMEAAAKAVKLSEDDCIKWSRWGQEIFADYFSVLLMGPWALWAMIDAEWNTRENLCLRRRDYPAPAIRLALMAQTLRSLNIDPSPALRGFDPEAIAKTDEKTARDLTVIPGAIAFASAPLPNQMGTLVDLCNANPAGGAFEFPKSAIQGWAMHLVGKQDQAAEQEMESARLVTCGALSAWASLELLSTEDRATDREKIRDRTVAMLQASAAPGDRTVESAFDVRAEADLLTTELLKSLRTSSSI